MNITVNPEIVPRLVGFFLELNQTEKSLSAIASG